MKTLPKILPVLIQGFYADFSSAEIDRIAKALRNTPGADVGFDELWEKFTTNKAVALYVRNEDGAIAGLCFYELRQHPDQSVEFFIEAGISLQPATSTREEQLVEATFPQFELFARFLKCQFVSFRTARAGLVAKAKKLGWSLRPELDGGEFLVRKVLA